MSRAFRALLILGLLAQSAFANTTISGEYGQYYVKFFSKTDFEPANLTLRIECDVTVREKTIDLISIM